MKRMFLILLAVVAGAASGYGAEFPPVPEQVGSALENYPSPWPVQFFALDVEGQSVRMAYQDVAPAGAPAGRTAVLLHGKNFFGDYWRDTAQFLSKHGWRVILVDQLGFGRSSKPDMTYSFFTLVSATRALIEHLGVRKATIIGHSMGGMIATRFALTYPAMVDRLVLTDPLGLEDYHAKVPPAATEELAKATLAESEESTLKFHQGYYPQWKPEYEVWAQLQSRAMQGGEGPRVAKAAALTYQMIYREPVCYEFARLTMPTLLTVGDKDRAALGKNRVSEEVRATMGKNLELARDVSTKLPPGSRLVIFPGVGHVPHLEAPEKFHEVLFDFLNH